MIAALLAAATLFLVCVAAVVRYSIVFPRQPVSGPLPALTEAELDSARRMRRHVAAIASRPHNMVHFEALERAAADIERTLIEIGHRPVRQEFLVEGKRVRNIEVVIEPGSDLPDPPCYVMGAHYDSPDDSPGANDNGTGVAALLEIARGLVRHRPRDARLRLVFFVNEEAPYGKTEAMGSWQYARALKDRGERVAGMFALETIGYFSDEPGSQQFPPPFGLIYPDKGNFVAFVALPGARRLLHGSLAAFRRTTTFPSVGGLAPGFIPGIDLSDHWAFHQFGFPALMITDSAPFRNPYYHQLDDLPENVDYDSLARVAAGLERMLRQLVA